MMSKLSDWVHIAVCLLGIGRERLELGALFSCSCRSGACCFGTRSLSSCRSGAFRFARALPSPRPPAAPLSLRSFRASLAMPGQRTPGSFPGSGVQADAVRFGTRRVCSGRFLVFMMVQPCGLRYVFVLLRIVTRLPRRAHVWIN